MTGREHFLAAEQLLASVEYGHWDDGSIQVHDEEEDTRDKLLAAQVHATLAYAAAYLPSVIAVEL